MSLSSGKNSAAFSSPLWGPESSAPGAWLPGFRAQPLSLGSRPAHIIIVTSDRRMQGHQRQLAALGAKVNLVVPLDRADPALIGPEAPDIILLDSRSSIEGSLAVIRNLKRNPLTHAIPIMVVTAPDVDARVQCLDEGAFDCIIGPLVLREMVAQIRAILRTKCREELLEKRLAFLEELANSDPLTNLLNRRGFIDRLHLEVERATRNGYPLSCIILDVDWFKNVNDRYGHRIGDDVLHQIAKVLVEGQRDGDTICRYGGEEFIWLLPGLDRDPLLERAEALRRTVEEIEIPTIVGSFHVTISIGASVYKFNEHGRVFAHALVEHADRGLLEAKKLGKNRVAFRELTLADHAPNQIEPEPAKKEPSLAVDRGTPFLPADETAELDGENVDGWDDWQREGQIPKDQRTLLRSSVLVLTAALEAKDPSTMAHCRRVATTAVAIGMELNLPPHDIERLELASLLHDIGKLTVPEAILQKQGPLSAEEWDTIRKHPERGAAILQKAKPFQCLVHLILYHQESFDGTGYPDGLRGHQIPLGARIIRVADTFDALLSDRPYRPRKTLEEVKVELGQMSGAGLDPSVVDVLLRLLTTMTPIEVQLNLRQDSDLGSEANRGHEWQFYEMKA